MHRSNGYERVVADVFLASRFDEFRDLRSELCSMINKFRARNLRLNAVDLNDGQASPRATVDECLQQVRCSQFMILLLGESYSSLAHGYQRSYTELEFEQATGDSSQVHVLAFDCAVVHESHRAADTRVAAFRQAVEAKLRIGQMNPAHSPSQVAAHIFQGLLAAVWERFLGLDDEDDSLPRELLEAIPSNVLREEEETATLEEQEAATRGMSLDDDDDDGASAIDPSKQPAAAAAREQRKEARTAISIGDHAAAITHLRRALDLRPLELKSNYWLALLYIAIGRKDLLSRAQEMAQRAAGLAEKQGTIVRAAACLEVAARAARRLGEVEQGLQIAERAVKLAGGYAFTHLERARQLMARGDRSRACDAVRSAGRVRSFALREAWSDPVLRPIRREIEAVAQELQQRQLYGLKSLIEFEERIPGASVEPSWRPTGAESLSQLTMLARASARRQCVALSSLVSQAASTRSQDVPDVGTDTAICEEIARANQELHVGFETLRSARSTGWGVASALVVVTLSVVVFDVSRVAFAWATLTSGVVAWRAFHVRSAAARKFRNASVRVGRLSQSRDLQASVRSVLSDFRRSVLNGAYRTAFKSPYSARIGDVVRVDPAHLSTIEQRTGRHVVLQRNLPAWLDADTDALPTLCRVASSTSSLLVLDEYSAFLRQ